MMMISGGYRCLYHNVGNVHHSSEWPTANCQNSLQYRLSKDFGHIAFTPEMEALLRWHAEIA